MLFFLHFAVFWRSWHKVFETLMYVERKWQKHLLTRTTLSNERREREGGGGEGHLREPYRTHCTVQRDGTQNPLQILPMRRRVLLWEKVGWKRITVFSTVAHRKLPEFGHLFPKVNNGVENHYKEQQPKNNNNITKITLQHSKIQNKNNSRLNSKGHIIMDVFMNYIQGHPMGFLRLQ